MDFVQYTKELLSSAAKEERLRKEQQKQEKLNADLLYECKRTIYDDISSEKIKKLLDEGASVNTRQKDGEYAGEYAITLAARRDPEIVKIFLEKGGVEKEALTETLFYGHLNIRPSKIEITKAILKAGADINAKYLYNEIEYSNIEFFAKNAAPEVLKAILEETKDNISQEALNSALTGCDYPVESDHKLTAALTSCALAFRRFADDCNGESYSYDTGIKVAILLDAGADVNATSENGFYIIAKSISHPKTLKLFLDKGCVSQEALDHALCIACTFEATPSKIESAKMLFAAGASVNGKTKYAFAIERAADKPEMLKLFLDKGGISKEAAAAAGISVPEQEETPQVDAYSTEYEDAAKVALQPENPENPGSSE